MTSPVQILGVVASGEGTAFPAQSLVSPRIGAQGDVLMSHLHGNLYEQAYRGRLFSVCNQAVVTTTAGLALTWTGLALSNPSTSGVNLVLRRFMCAQVAVGAASAIGLMTGAGNFTGALTVRAAKVGGASSVTVASAAATIVGPVLERVLGSVGSVATTAYASQPVVSADLEGGMIIPPGFYVASYTTAITTAALVFGLVWEEVAA